MTFADDKAAVEARAETLLGQAGSYLAALKALAGAEVVTGTTELPESYDYATVPQVSFPVVGASRPDIAGSLVFPGAPEAPTGWPSAMAPPIRSTADSAEPR